MIARPTRIPFGAIFAPVGGILLSALAGILANVFRQGSRLAIERSQSDTS
jgi:hypothetical protein